MKLTFRSAVMAIVTVLIAAFPAFAQAPDTGAGWSQGLGYIGAGIGFGIAAGLAGMGQGRVGAAACEGMARNPGAGGRIQTAMILGLAFIETLVIFTFVVVLIKI